MPERTEPFDVDALLVQILTTPTLGAQILMNTARELDEQPFLVITDEALADALTKGTDTALAPHVPAIVAEEAMLRSASVLPDIRPGETAGEFAIRLRSAAGAI
ncbi:hypothetical protein AB0J25_11965 [Streptomyces sp. NPDC049910]|uniref:hypothetical protein n=1 Tax=Streptomyces sp. NPDC049910 TaxID=3155278 RepID=UPI003422FC47